MKTKSGGQIINGGATVSGNLVPSGSSYTLGISTNYWGNLYTTAINFISATAGTILPLTTLTYNLGSTIKYWLNLYVGNIYATSVSISSSLNTRVPVTFNRSDVSGISQIGDVLYVERQSGERRWVFSSSNVESGGNTGNDFFIVRCDDSGNAISTCFSITRQTGACYIGGALSSSSSITAGTSVNGTTGNITTVNATTGNITTVNATTGNITTVESTLGNITTVSSTSVYSGIVETVGNITAGNDLIATANFIGLDTIVTATSEFYSQLTVSAFTVNSGSWTAATLANIDANFSISSTTFNFPHYGVSQVTLNVKADTASGGVNYLHVGLYNQSTLTFLDTWVMIVGGNVGDAAPDGSRSFTSVFYQADVTDAYSVAFYRTGANVTNVTVNGAIVINKRTA